MCNDSFFSSSTREEKTARGVWVSMYTERVHGAGRQSCSWRSCLEIECMVARTTSAWSFDGPEHFQ